MRSASSCVEFSDASLDVIVRVAPVSILWTVCSTLFLRVTSWSDPIEIPVSSIQIVELDRYKSLNLSAELPKSYVLSVFGKRWVEITTLFEPLLVKLVMALPPPPLPCKSSPGWNLEFAVFHFNTWPFVILVRSISVKLDDARSPSVNTEPFHFRTWFVDGDPTLICKLVSSPNWVYNSLITLLIFIAPSLRVSPVPSFADTPTFTFCLAIVGGFFYSFIYVISKDSDVLSKFTSCLVKSGLLLSRSNVTGVISYFPIPVSNLRIEE